jgi:hypothetical protein
MICDVPSAADAEFEVLTDDDPLLSAVVSSAPESPEIGDSVVRSEGATVPAPDSSSDVDDLYRLLDPCEESDDPDDEAAVLVVGVVVAVGVGVSDGVSDGVGVGVGVGAAVVGVGSVEVGVGAVVVATGAAVVSAGAAVAGTGAAVVAIGASVTAAVVGASVVGAGVSTGAAVVGTGVSTGTAVVGVGVASVGVGVSATGAVVAVASVAGAAVVATGASVTAGVASPVVVLPAVAPVADPEDGGDDVTSAVDPSMAPAEAASTPASCAEALITATSTSTTTSTSLARRPRPRRERRRCCGGHRHILCGPSLEKTRLAAGRADKSRNPTAGRVGSRGDGNAPPAETEVLEMELDRNQCNGQ